MKRHFLLGTLVAFVLAWVPLALPAPAQAAMVECFGVVSGNPNHPYPVDATNRFADAGHYRECIAENPDPATRQRIGLVEGYLESTPGNGALMDLQKRGVTFYYFATRDDFNSYMGAKGGAIYKTTTSRCGHTYSKGGNALGLISAVFDSCTYNGTGKTTLNLNPVEAMKHESGHSFSFAVGSINNDKAPHTGPADSAAYASTGLSGIVQDDLDIFDETWNNTPVNQRDNYVCSIFGHGDVLTDLEKDLKTTLVCPGGNIVAQYKGKMPSVLLPLALPYFFMSQPGSALYNEVWANEMINNTRGPGGTEIMPETEYVLGRLSCLTAVQEGYYIAGVAPQKTDPRYNACTGLGFTPPDPTTFH